MTEGECVRVSVCQDKWLSAKECVVVCDVPARACLRVWSRASGHACSACVRECVCVCVRVRAGGRWV